MSKIGDAVVQKNNITGDVYVLRADPVIRVSAELLNNAEPWVWDGTTLTLDTAATYRYREVGPDPDDPRCLIFERLTDLVEEST